MNKIKTMVGALLLTASTANASEVVYLECNYLNGDEKPAKVLVTANESSQTVTHTFTHSGLSNRVKAIFSPAELAYKTDQYSVHTIDRSNLTYVRTITVGKKVFKESGTCEVIEAPKKRKF